MEEAGDLVYSEELIMNGKSVSQFAALIHDAALTLHWQLLNFTENQLLYQTPFSTDSRGEFVQIFIVDDKAGIQVSPVNEYYWSQEQNVKIVAQLKAELDEQTENLSIKERSKHPMYREKYGALLLSKTYIVTPLLLYICAILFLMMIIAGVSPITPTAKSLFVWGGNFKDAVIGGQWWRLISYMFLHAGAMHLIMNGFALLYAGMYLEPLIGRIRLVSAYVLTGISAGIASLIIHPHSVGVGASGAIFGLYGVFFALLTTNYLQKTARKTMLRSLLFFVVFNLLMGLQGNTDNAAHIGGLLSGILIGYLFYPAIKKSADHPQTTKQ
ncbi:MAG: rhomboid family intramembrane serine protease [Chitinophagaceae bacterium]